MDRRKLANRNQRGLTLVELLVVIVILALASSVVMLNAPPSRPEARDDAERFAARLTLAFDEAIAGGDALRIRFDPKGYSFEKLTDGDWEVVEDVAALSPRALHGRTGLVVEASDAANGNARALGDDEPEDEDAEKGVSTIALDPLGAQTPFRAVFSSADGVWTVKVDETGSVRVNNDG